MKYFNGLYFAIDIIGHDFGILVSVMCKSCRTSMFKGRFRLAA